MSIRRRFEGTKRRLATGCQLVNLTKTDSSRLNGARLAAMIIDMTNCRHLNHEKNAESRCFQLSFVELFILPKSLEFARKRLDLAAT
jgi:hypothetical protein